MGRRYRMLCVAVVLGLWNGVTAGPYFQVQFGPSWPQDIRQNAPEGRRIALEAAGKAGITVGEIAALGMAVDVLWNRSAQDSTWRQPQEFDSTQMVTITEETEVERWVLFPLSFFVTLDPLPGLAVRPAVTGQFGVTMMAYGNKEFDGDLWVKTSDSGFYPGLFGKVSVDAISNLGTDAVGAMVGLSYQWAQPRRRLEDSRNIYTHKYMNGIGLHVGLRFSLH